MANRLLNHEHDAGKGRVEGLEVEAKLSEHGGECGTPVVGVEQKQSSVEALERFLRRAPVEQPLHSADAM